LGKEAWRNQGCGSRETRTQRKHGSKAEVWNRLAQVTKGNLNKESLFKCDKTGKMNSKRQSELARAELNVFLGKTEEENGITITYDFF
jgi:hypothetical protein